MESKNEIGKVFVKVVPDTTEIDEALEKARQFRDLMREAMEIADSIAHMDLNVRISSVVNDAATELASITTE